MSTPLHVPAATAPPWQVLGESVRCLLSGEHTGGAFALFHITTEPGFGPPTHVHTREDETFHILGGEYEFTIDGRPVTARLGDTLFAPRNTPHAYRCTSPGTGTMLLQATPAGFEHFLAAVAAQIGTRLPPDMAVLGQLFDQAGLRMG